MQKSKAGSRAGRLATEVVEQGYLIELTQWPKATFVSTEELRSCFEARYPYQIGSRVATLSVSLTP